ncbi:MAG: ornithine carbamoyltransferase [Firmicutes bacterium]|nr:ornithine carbamoyltransferase [Bacillota bacterium]
MLRHLPHFKDWSAGELLELLEKALYLKEHLADYAGILKGKTMAMIFQKTSTRTRLSFEAGMTRLGGHAVYMDWRATNLVLAEIKDEIRYIAGNADLVMARLLHHKDLLEMIAYATVPVINGCDDRYHPCQAFCDLLTLREKLGRLQGIKLVYVGVWNNVLNSLVDLCHKIGVYLVAIAPIVNEPSWDPELLAAAERSGFFRRAEDLRTEVRDADAVYTDSWVDMEFFLDPAYEAEKKRRLELMLPYQLNAANLAGSRALIMHDMPIHPGYEIDRAMIEDERSIIFPQSWNRMHGQNAIILRLLGLL